MEVEAVQFDFRLNSVACDLIEQFEQDPTGRCKPREINYAADQFRDKLPTISVKQAPDPSFYPIQSIPIGSICKQTERQDAPQTVGSMDRHSTNRVVDL